MNDLECVNIPCDLCGTPGPAFLLEEKGYTVCQCTRCRLVFVNPQPQRALGEDAGHFADEDWFDVAERTARESAPIWDDGLQRLAERADGPGRLLDVGCGHGFFLQRARERGWAVEGIDVSAEALTYARGSLGLEALQQCDFLQAAYPDGHFDAVTLWNSLEHVPSPSATLDKALRVLRPGGVLMVRVPNMDFSRLIWPLRWLIRRMGLDLSYLASPPPHHLYGFDPRTLGRLFEAQGFEIESVVPAGAKVGHYWRMNWRLGAAATLSAGLTNGLYGLTGGRLNIAATIYAFGRRPAA